MCEIKPRDEPNWNSTHIRLIKLSSKIDISTAVEVGIATTCANWSVILQGQLPLLPKIKKITKTQTVA